MWTRERVSQLSGLTYAQVRRLEETGLLQGTVLYSPFDAGGQGGALHTFSAREVLNALIIAWLRRAGVSLQRIHKAVDYLRTNLDIERPLEEAIFLVDTSGNLFAIAYTVADLREFVLDVAQRQGQVAIAPVVLGELWERVKALTEQQERRTSERSIAVA